MTITTSIGTSSLIQYQSTEAFFTVTNASANSQQFTAVGVSFPAFLCVVVLPEAGCEPAVPPVAGEPATEPSAAGCDPVGNGCPPSTTGALAVHGLPDLASGDSLVLHLRVCADSPLQPGDGLLVVTATTTDLVTGRQHAAVAAQAITFSVQRGISGVDAGHRRHPRVRHWHPPGRCARHGAARIAAHGHRRRHIGQHHRHRRGGGLGHRRRPAGRGSSPPPRPDCQRLPTL